MTASQCGVIGPVPVRHLPVSAVSVIEAVLRSDEAIAHALPALAATRGVDLRTLERRAGLQAGYVQELVDGSLEEPPDHALDALARALDVPPSFFFEYRLRAVREALGRDVPRLNRLFLEVLTPLEQSAIGRDGMTNSSLTPAVAQLLAEQQLTQGELAESIGLSQSHVSRMLRDRFPVPEFLEMIALALGVEPHYFREYRSEIVADYLRRRPQSVNDLFDEFGDPLALEPYIDWTPRRLLAPELAEPKELLGAMIEVVRAEGPVLGRRVYRLMLGACTCELTATRKSLLNRAAAALTRKGIIVADDETGEQTQIGRVLRLPEVAPVVPRRRGPRRIQEVPLRELAAVAQAAADTRRLNTANDLQDVLCSLYDVQYPNSPEREHMNKALGRVLRPE